MKNILAFLSFIMIIPSIGYAQLILPKEITGEYEFKDSLMLVGMSLTLNENGKYFYRTGTDLETRHSYGTWKNNGDTIFLNASIKQDDIPLRIEETEVDSIKRLVVFGMIENLDGDAMSAVIYLNGDTTSVCIPLLEMGCERKAGSVDSFKITFNNNATYSKWIKVKNKKANRLHITANVHDVLALYLFLNDEKFLFKNGYITPLENNEITVPDLNGKIIKRKVILERVSKSLIQKSQY